MFVGLGRRINLPVSSQDILKSLSTSRVLEVIMEAAITLLCTPSSKIVAGNQITEIKKIKTIT